MLAVMIRFRFLSLILVWIIVALDASTSSDTKRFDVRNMFAGGLAGGMSNAIIYPIDTIKTVKQIASSKTDAAARLSKIFSPEGFVKLYSGFIPAVVGAIPSSAIYFGTYETMKQFLSTREKKLHRPFIHMISAASGNIASSFVFVPKETIKQQLQAIKMGSVEWAYSSDVNFITVSRNIIRTNGIKGFFPSYRATLLRNVASAMVRFTVYEELKLAIGQHLDKQYESLGFMVAGATASTMSSLLTTPIDVVKTRLATGLLPAGSPVIASIVQIARKEGVIGLYAGVGERLLWSALFGGIGFTCFERSKRLLGIPEVAV